MNRRGRFKAQKGLEVLLYIARQCPDTYEALKVLYVADKKHLEGYGRQICGDSYVAMKSGPVPSAVYDMVKFVRGDGFCVPDVDVEEAFEVRDEYTIVPIRDPDIGLLSESDIECLDWAIEKIKQLPPGGLKWLTHDKAWEAADRNETMSLESIVKTLPDAEDLLEYLQDTELVI